MSGTDHVRQLQFRTRMCNKSDNGLLCDKLGECQFAHALEELRPAPNLTMTKMCPKHRYCDSRRCRFAHSYSDLRRQVDVEPVDPLSYTVSTSKVFLVLYAISPNLFDSVRSKLEKEAKIRLRDGLNQLMRGSMATSCIQGILYSWSRVASAIIEGRRSNDRRKRKPVAESQNGTSQSNVKWFDGFNQHFLMEKLIKSIKSEELVDLPNNEEYFEITNPPENIPSTEFNYNCTSSIIKTDDHILMNDLKSLIVSICSPSISYDGKLNSDFQLYFSELSFLTSLWAPQLALLLHSYSPLTHDYNFNNKDSIALNTCPESNEDVSESCRRFCVASRAMKLISNISSNSIISSSSGFNVDDKLNSPTLNAVSYSNNSGKSMMPSASTEVQSSSNPDSNNSSTHPCCMLHAVANFNYLSALADSTKLHQPSIPPPTSACCVPLPSCCVYKSSLCPRHKQLITPLASPVESNMSLGDCMILGALPVSGSSDVPYWEETTVSILSVLLYRGMLSLLLDAYDSTSTSMLHDELDSANLNGNTVEGKDINCLPVILASACQLQMLETELNFLKENYSCNSDQDSLNHSFDMLIIMAHLVARDTLYPEFAASSNVGSSSISCLLQNFLPTENNLTRAFEDSNGFLATIGSLSLDVLMERAFLNSAAIPSKNNLNANLTTINNNDNAQSSNNIINTTDEEAITGMSNNQSTILLLCPCGTSLCTEDNGISQASHDSTCRISLSCMQGMIQAFNRCLSAPLSTQSEIQAKKLLCMILSKYTAEIDGVRNFLSLLLSVYVSVSFLFKRDSPMPRECTQIQLANLFLTRSLLRDNLTCPVSSSSSLHLPLMRRLIQVESIIFSNLDTLPLHALFASVSALLPSLRTLSAPPPPDAPPREPSLQIISPMATPFPPALRPPPLHSSFDSTRVLFVACATDVFGHIEVQSIVGPPPAMQQVVGQRPPPAESLEIASDVSFSTAGGLSIASIGVFDLQNTAALKHTATFTGDPMSNTLLSTDGNQPFDDSVNDGFPVSESEQKARHAIMRSRFMSLLDALPAPSLTCLHCELSLVNPAIALDPLGALNLRKNSTETSSILTNIMQQFAMSPNPPPHDKDLIECLFSHFAPQMPTTQLEVLPTTSALGRFLALKSNMNALKGSLIVVNGDLNTPSSSSSIKTKLSIGHLSKELGGFAMSIDGQGILKPVELIDVANPSKGLTLNPGAMASTNDNFVVPHPVRQPSISHGKNKYSSDKNYIPTTVSSNQNQNSNIVMKFQQMMPTRFDSKQSSRQLTDKNLWAANGNGVIPVSSENLADEKDQNHTGYELSNHLREFSLQGSTFVISSPPHNQPALSPYYPKKSVSLSQNDFNGGIPSQYTTTHIVQHQKSNTINYFNNNNSNNVINTHSPPQIQQSLHTQYSNFNQNLHNLTVNSNNTNVPSFTHKPLRSSSDLQEQSPHIQKSFLTNASSINHMAFSGCSNPCQRQISNANNNYSINYKNNAIATTNHDIQYPVSPSHLLPVVPSHETSFAYSAFGFTDWPQTKANFPSAQQSKHAAKSEYFNMSNLVTPFNSNLDPYPWAVETSLHTNPHISNNLTSTNHNQNPNLHWSPALQQVTLDHHHLIHLKQPLNGPKQLQSHSGVMTGGSALNRSQSNVLDGNMAQIDGYVHNGSNVKGLSPPLHPALANSNVIVKQASSSTANMKNNNNLNQQMLLDSKQASMNNFNLYVPNSSGNNNIEQNHFSGLDRRGIEGDRLIAMSSVDHQISDTSISTNQSNQFFNINSNNNQQLVDNNGNVLVSPVRYKSSTLGVDAITARPPIRFSSFHQQNKNENIQNNNGMCHTDKNIASGRSLSPYMPALHLSQHQPVKTTSFSVGVNQQYPISNNSSRYIEENANSGVMHNNNTINYRNVQSPLLNAGVVDKQFSNVSNTSSSMDFGSNLYPIFKNTINNGITPNNYQQNHYNYNYHHNQIQNGNNYTPMTAIDGMVNDKPYDWGPC